MLIGVATGSLHPPPRIRINFGVWDVREKIGWNEEQTRHD